MPIGAGMRVHQGRASLRTINVMKTLLLTMLLGLSLSVPPVAFGSALCAQLCQCACQQPSPCGGSSLRRAIRLCRRSCDSILQRSCVNAQLCGVIRRGARNARDDCRRGVSAEEFCNRERARAGCPQ